MVEPVHGHPAVGIGLDHVEPGRPRQNGRDVRLITPGIVTDVDIRRPDNRRIPPIMGGNYREWSASAVKRHANIDGGVRIDLVSDIKIIGHHVAHVMVVSLNLHKGRGPAGSGILTGTGGLFWRGGILVGRGLGHPGRR